MGAPTRLATTPRLGGHGEPEGGQNIRASQVILNPVLVNGSGR